MTREIQAAIALACAELFTVDVDIELTRPDPQFGDYATNVALRLAKQLDRSPRLVADQLAGHLRTALASDVAEVTVAGPGFINLTLHDRALVASLQTEPAQLYQGQVVVAEYSDPNPFKVLHAGHIYTTVVGDAIANLVAAAGGEVHRVNYGGDVGLHVAKSMWAIVQTLGGEHPEKLTAIAEHERANWLAARYVEGTTAYETDDVIKTEIVALNKRVYQLLRTADRNSPFAQIYWLCRQWSYEAFDAFYARLGTRMERYYPESEVAELGLQLVKEHVGNVFEESKGAIVFKGEAFNLHTRVFINSEGLPTYEAKEVGLIVQKDNDYHFDRSIVVTANEQEQYMSVVLKAIEQFLPELAGATTYVPHGMIRLAGNVKMSSRKGNGIPATEVLDVTAAANKQLTGQDNHDTVLGAIKYSFLKNRIGGNLVYEPKESVSLEGNSGPYLQYAHARARSILAKATSEGGIGSELDADERLLARKISEYPEVVDRAVQELMPHHICTYLYELAQTFNRFYENNRVIGDERETNRLALVALYASRLRHGLGLLGIASPNKM